jgi:hypothetical protein
MNSQRTSSIKKSNSINSEDEQIKNIIKEINSDFKQTLFFDIRTPNKLRTLVRNKSNFSTININSNKKNTLKRENSLTFKLKNKINKESLIMELRQELKYHIKFNYIYKSLLKKIIQLKDLVKDNKEQVENNTNALKETFKDRFDIIDNYEKTIKLLELEKKELITSSTEIIKMRENTHKNLLKQFSEIQEQNDEQRQKIDGLTKNITLLEYKKSHINDELQTQLDLDERKYEKNLRLYKSLMRKYEYFLEEYNAYIKSGNEIAKIDVKLNDNTNAKNTLIEEDLDIELNEQLLRKKNLMDNINELKIKIKILEDKQKEDKLKHGKTHFCKVMGLYKTKMRHNIFRKSASNKNYKMKIIYE